tara:strand:+ start:1498 stop:2412 length:915 start_codon:yes stop_codon:yes gene_type:complete
MKIVIVRLGNGLGNQLFTYATAYVFAKKNNAKLYVDDESGFYKRYKYGLNNFRITAPIIEKKYKFLGYTGRIKRKVLQKINIIKKDKIFLIEKKDKNKLTYYNPEQLNINFSKKIYIEGYFQSEKYFLNHKDDLLKEFTFKENIQLQNSSFINEIKDSNSVSIHIRQERFLASEGHKNLNELNNKFLKYNIDITKRGVEYFDRVLKNPKYFLWSNNFDKLKDYFPSNKFIFVNENLKKDPAYDLFLMSQCKHFVLSPSTFHYWGAYLSTNKNKICIAPDKTIYENSYYGFSNNKDIKSDWWKEI